MPSVVFLRGVNVGRNNRCQPAAIAKELAKFDVVNVGAAGTFVVRKPIGRAKLRREFQRRLRFETVAIICSAKEVLELESAASWESCESDIVRFVGILAKRRRALPELPFNLPPGGDWLVRLLAVQGRFAFGLYRRNMRTISCLTQLEKKTWHFYVRSQLEHFLEAFQNSFT